MSFTRIVDDKRKSEQRGLVDRVTLSKAAKPKSVRLCDIGVTVNDQIRKDPSCCGGMHHAVAAESVGEKKPRNFRHRPKNGVMIGCHLVEASPGALGIHRQI